MPETKPANRPRPCSICHCWFRPDGRGARGQKTCSKVCSKKLAAKRDANWRAKNPDYEEYRGLRAALEKPGDAAIKIQPPTSPLARVPWRSVQVAVGFKMAVVLAFALRLHAARCQVPFKGKTRILTCIPDRLRKNFDQVPMGRAP